MFGFKDTPLVLTMGQCKPDEQKFATLRSWAKVAPLLAALISPITSLMDIPALAQPWYTEDGVQPTNFKTPRLVLSGIGLAFNLIANGLIVMRFSVTTSYWKLATQLSLYCWIAKTVIALINITIFGVHNGNSPGFQYAEGFWCAVVSGIGSGIISFLLLFHYIFRGDYSDEEGKKIRIAGRHFMLSIIFLTSLLALEGLIFCMVENWTYLDALYFATITMLTIGFGDFVPTTIATKIVLFPFAVLTIIQLANQVRMIIEFSSQRREERKVRWRRRYEALQDTREISTKHEHNPDGNLKKEVNFLVAQAQKEENLCQMYHLGWSFTSLIVFWVVGAVIFSHLESWPYGDGIYFCYVSFLTIGYGDYVPSSPAGRVVFIVYAMMVVPIVASFAIQAMTQILQTFSDRRLAKQKEKQIHNSLERKDESYMSHAELVVQQHRSFHRERKSFLLRSRSQSTNIGSTSDGDRDPEVEGVQETGPAQSNGVASIENGEEINDLDKWLVKRVLQLSVELEMQARVLLMHALPKGSRPEVLLRADMRLQYREVQNLNLDDADTKIVPEGLIDLAAPESMDVDIDKRLKRYREIFAALLATGSQLRRLDGLEQLAWERRTRRVEAECVSEDVPEKKRELDDQNEENRAIDGGESAMKMV